MFVHVVRVRCVDARLQMTTLVHCVQRLALITWQASNCIITYAHF